MCGCANEKMRMVVALFSLSTGSANLLVCIPFTEAKQKRGRDKGQRRVSSRKLANRLNSPTLLQLRGDAHLSPPQTG